MKTHKFHTRAFNVTLFVTLLIISLSNFARAEDSDGGKWLIRLEPIYMSVYGQDQHVLNIHRINYDTYPAEQYTTGITLNTNSGTSIAGEFRYGKGHWAGGVDFWVLYTSQNTPDQVDFAGGSDGSEMVVYEVAGREYTSTDSSQRLYFRTRTDTALQVWTLNLYGMRNLLEEPDSAIRLQMGVKIADFDNDYRAVVGIEGMGGTMLDASSNYSLMLGPLVSLLGEFRVGRSRFEGYFSQSFVIGDVEQTSGSSDFLEQFTGDEADLSYDVFAQKREVGVPISEFRLKWIYELGRHIGLGLGANTSVWWDIPVPPRVNPSQEDGDMLHENSVIFFGLLASLEYRF